MDVKRCDEQDKLDCEAEQMTLDARSLSERYAERGVAKVMRDSLTQQIEREAETCELAPNAYRLSTDETARKGNEEMTASDLLEYFDQTRSMRLQGRDFLEEANQALIESDVEDQASKTALCQRDKQTPDSAKGKQKALRMIDSLKRRCASWTDTSTVDSANRKPFPLSFFAAIVAVAMSLMLIVAGSVIVAQAEGRVNVLNREIDSVTLEVTDLQADWNVQNDLIAIRQIAMKEYGMIQKEYVKAVYLPLTRGESVEVLEEETREGIRLSALLNAIGIDLGE